MYAGVTYNNKKSKEYLIIINLILYLYSISKLNHDLSKYLKFNSESKLSL